jgi:hypothetical protein
MESFVDDAGNRKNPLKRACRTRGRAVPAAGCQGGDEALMISFAAVGRRVGEI